MLEKLIKLADELDMSGNFDGAKTIDSMIKSYVENIAPAKPSPGYITLYPQRRNIKQAIEYKPIFFVTISAVFLLLTSPASNMVKPAAIHITRAPVIRK